MENKIKTRKRLIITFVITTFISIMLMSIKKVPPFLLILAITCLLAAIITGISYFVVNSKIKEAKLNEERIKKQAELQQKQQLIDLENQVKKEILKTKLNELQKQSHLYKCNYCNTTFEEKSNFCKYCGAKLIEIDFNDKI